MVIFYVDFPTNCTDLASLTEDQVTSNSPISTKEETLLFTSSRDIWEYIVKTVKKDAKFYVNRLFLGE